MAQYTKRSAALASVGSGLLLTAMKIVVGFMTGSLAIISEAAHSGLDLLAAMITFFVVYIAEQPPDENHPYGHGKAESLGALAEAALLVATALWVLWHAYERIFISPSVPEVTIWSFLVMVASVVIDYTRARSLKRAADEHKSPALRADAAHFTNDMLGSLVVLVSLGILEIARRTDIIPSWLALRADALGAAVVAIIALKVSYSLGKESVNALMEDVPGELSRRLSTLVRSVPGLLGDSVRVRVRFVGEQPFVDVSFQVPRSLSLEETHVISSRVREVILSELPAADIVTDVAPARTEGEEQTTAVYATANRLGMSIHNLDLFQLQTGYVVNLDLELPSHLSLGEAESYSDHLDRALKLEMPEGTQISIHIETRRDTPRPAVLNRSVEERIASALRALPEADAVVGVKVFMVDEGAIVNIVCRYPPETSLSEAHVSMSSLERKLREGVDGIVRVHIDPVATPPAPIT